jgi:hypothetical protein
MQVSPGSTKLGFARTVRAVVVPGGHMTPNSFGALRPNGRRARQISRVIAAAFLAAFFAVAAFADDAQDSRLSDDIELTKATVSLLAAKDFAAVRDRLDPAIGQASDEALRKMSELIGTSEPSAIETISAAERHNLQTGDGTSLILLEYKLTGQWVVVDAAVKTEAGSKRLPRLYLTANTLPLRELNAFHLFGKGALQYSFLAAWIATIALTGWAIIIAFRRHTGWRRWALIGLMPLGLTPTVAVNWNTAQVWVLEATSNSAGYVVPIIAIRYPMALFAHTELGATYFYVAAPLIAIGYLIWQRGWKRLEAMAA